MTRGLSSMSAAWRMARDPVSPGDFPAGILTAALIDRQDIHLPVLLRRPFGAC